MDLANVVIRGRSFLYQPEIYAFKSGKKKGTTLLSLMFSDPSYLAWQKRILDSEMTTMTSPNRLHLHLAWILSVGESLEAPVLCPYCLGEKRNIKMFSVRHSSGECTYGHEFVCCNDVGCKQKLNEERSSLLPLKFSSLRQFRNTEQKRMGKFFKEIFLGTERFDSDKAFRLFLSSTTLIR